MPQYSTTHRNNNMADITTQVGTTGYIHIYSGTVPTNCGTTATGTVLVSLPCTNPFGAAPSGGVLTASAITPTLPVASGTAGYYRLCSSSVTNAASGSNVVMQGPITELGLSSTAIATGITVTISSFTDTANGA